MRQKLEGWSHSIQAKMMAYFATLFLLVISGMIVFYKLSVDNIYETARESVTNTMKQISSDTDRILSNALDQANKVARDADIQVSLRAPLPSDKQEMYKQRVGFNYILYDRNRFLKDINGIYVIGANGAAYRSSRYGLRDKDFRACGWYNTVVQTGEVLWQGPHPGSDIVFNLDASTISVGVPIYDRASTKILGVVVVEVLTEELRQIEDGDLVFQGSTFILNEQNQIIYRADGKASERDEDWLDDALCEQGMEDFDGTGVIEIDGTRYLVSVTTLSDSKWKIIGLISYEEMYRQSKGLRNSILVTILGFGVVAIAFAIIGSSNIAKPIREVRTTMREVEKGDFTVSVKEHGRDEVGDLGRSFNHMIQKMNVLMEKEQENQEKLRLAEFKALQSQINPHFLYNTLDSINWMARMNQIDKVEEMNNALTNFLRIGLSRGKTYITLEEELEHVKNYVAIQKIRYARLLNYKENISDAMKQNYVIKMILQPIVENGLYHGIKEKGVQGTITVTAEEQEDKLIIRIADDGQGMTEEKLREVENMMEKGIDFDPNAYGVINVQRRIQTYFGKEYGLHFESEYGKGTVVYVTLPKRGEDEFVKGSHN